MGPEESMQIQSNLASTIAMAFDECPLQCGHDRVLCRKHLWNGPPDGCAGARRSWSG